MYISYFVRIKKNPAVRFDATIHLYRQAVDFFIGICLKHWEAISSIEPKNYQIKYIEELTIPGTMRIGTVPDDINFTLIFPLFPSYLRRVAIKHARGLVASRMKHLAKWEALPCDKRGKRPGVPTAGKAFPFMYNKHMYQRIDLYRAKIKIYNEGKWEWIDIGLCKSDVDYIQKHCIGCKEVMPKLVQKKSKWFLQFPFIFFARAQTVPVNKQIAVGVDLGIHNICTCAVMNSKGEILGREFLHDNIAHTIMASINKKKEEIPE